MVDGQYRTQYPIHAKHKRRLVASMMIGCAPRSIRADNAPLFAMTRASDG
jgi:hypothetical protein